MSENKRIKILHKLLKEKIETGELVKDYISDENIFAIETNIDFFNGVQIEEIRDIFIELIELIFDYTDKKFRNNMLNIGKKYNPSKNKKPIKKIENDLKIMKQYRDMIIRLVGVRALLPNLPRETLIAYKQNEKMINDLENKEYKIIPRSIYYSSVEYSKIDIKSFLKHIQEKYNLKNTSLDKKQLIDMIK